MTELYREGKIKALGVCNCTPDTLEYLIKQSGIVPAVNQVECHPLLTRNEICQYCKENGIQMEAWSPLMQGHLAIPTLQTIAETHQKSEAQIVLRWYMQRGTIIIPKTTSKKRLQENGDIFDFSLTEEEMDRIDSLNQNKHFGPDMYDIEGNARKYSYFETPEDYLSKSTNHKL